MIHRQHDEEALIPWYMNGTLDAEARAKVEAHLAACESCGSLIDLLGDFRTLSQRTDSVGLREHPQAQLLLEYVEAADSLDGETTAWVAAHLQGCEVCRDAAVITEELLISPNVPDLHEFLAAPAGKRSTLERWWRALTGTVLRPVPAAVAYLLLAALLAYPGARRWIRGPESTSEASAHVQPARVLPPTIRLESTTRFRNDSGTPPDDAAVEIAAPENTALLLELRTGIDREDLDDVSTHFELEILADEQVWLHEIRGGSDFDRGGVLRVLLDPEALPQAATYAARIRLLKSGDALDRQIVFDRSFRLIRP